MYKETIAVDCDEVLSETTDALLAYHNFQFTGKPLQKDDISTYSFHELPQFEATQQDAIDYFDSFFSDDEARAMIQPVSGAREKVEELKRQGARLVVVTARWSKYRKTTQKWLEEHFPGLFSDLLFADHFSEAHVDKSVLCKRVGATHLVEDNLAYAQEATQAGISAYLLDKPWNSHYDNQQHRDIVKVNDWKELAIPL